MIEFTREHEAELAWYFADHHSAIGDRSTFGAQLEAMRLASGGSDGTRIRTKASVDSATWARRSARVAAGDEAVSEDEPAPSAKPTRRDRGNDGFTPSDRALEAYAVTSRALMRLSEEEVRALGAYYVLGDRFIAGPYTAPSLDLVRTNIYRAQLIGVAVIEAGALALVPHTLSSCIETCLPESRWLQHGLGWLAECHAVLLVPGWETSRGTLAEIEHAKTLQLPIWEAYLGPVGWELPGTMLDWLGRQTEAS